MAPVLKRGENDTLSIFDVLSFERWTGYTIWGSVVRGPNRRRRRLGRRSWDLGAIQRSGFKRGDKKTNA